MQLDLEDLKNSKYLERKPFSQLLHNEELTVLEKSEFLYQIIEVKHLCPKMINLDKICCELYADCRENHRQHHQRTKEL